MSTCRLKILYDFGGQYEGELEVKKNEIVTMVEAQEEWTRVENESGSIGLIPRNYYIQESQDSVFTLQQILFSNYGYKNLLEYLRNSPSGKLKLYESYSMSHTYESYVSYLELNITKRNVCIYKHRWKRVSISNRVYPFNKYRSISLG